LAFDPAQSGFLKAVSRRIIAEYGMPFPDVDDVNRLTSSVVIDAMRHPSKCGLFSIRRLA
jgi:hypothetical protein